MVVRQLITLPSQLQLIDRLQHHIYLSSSLIFVSGEQGAGKSTLLEQLSNKLPSNVQEAFIQLNEQLSDSQVRQQIIMQLYDEPLFDAHDSLFSSIALLQEKHNTDIPRLIIFDNAHYLSEQLRLELADLIAKKELLSENEMNVLLLVDDLNSQQMLTSLNHICACLEFKLEALSREEASSLLEHIFQQAGYQHKIQHQDAVSKQLIACAGIPQKIIALAEKIIAGELDNNSSSWLKTRLPAILVMLFLLAIAAGLASYLYPLFIKPEQSTAPVNELPEKMAPSLDEVEASPSSINKIVIEQVKPEMVEELAGKWDKEGLIDIEEASLEVGLSDADVQREIISESQISALVQSEEEPLVNVGTDITTAEEIEVQEKPQRPEPQKNPVSVMQDNQPVLEVRDLQELKEAAHDEKVNTPLETKKTELDDEHVAVEPLPDMEVQPTNENTLDAIFTEKTALLAISPSQYTLQLSAMASENSLLQFVSEHGLATDNLFIYQTVRNNKPWYVVIFGKYASWASAKKASKTLPDSLANMDSWIKKYELVHRDLQLNNE